MPRAQKRSLKRTLRQWPAKIAGLITLAAIAMLALELTNTTHLFHKSSIPPVIPTSTNTSGTSTPSSKGNGQISSPSGTQSSDKQSASSSATNSSATLLAPFGNFVSNHHPNLSGRPAPSQEVSVCNTTPGASCYISINRGNISTKLPARTADSSGSVYWSWDVGQDAHLTSGDWTITAVATLNGKTKKTQDQIPLTVKQ